MPLYGTVGPVRDGRGDDGARGGSFEDAVLVAACGARERHRRAHHDARVAVPRACRSRRLEDGAVSKRSTKSSRAVNARIRRRAPRGCLQAAGPTLRRCVIRCSRRGRNVEDGTVDSSGELRSVRHRPRLLGHAARDRRAMAGSRAAMRARSSRSTTRGNLVWRGAYAASETDTALSVVRTIPRRDASITALATGAIGSSFSLLSLRSIGRSALGAVLLVAARCMCLAGRARARDRLAARGVLVFGECQSQGKAFSVHIRFAPEMRRSEALDGRRRGAIRAHRIRADAAELGSSSSW